MIRSIIAIVSALFFTAQLTSAQSVPVISTEPLATRTMDREMFEFVSKLLGGSLMYPHLRCTLKTRSSRELRTFSKGSEWIETLEVDFNSNGFDSGYKMSFKIPSTAKYGTKKGNNPWSGRGEDIRIELDDSIGHWLSLTHDGKGRLVRLVLGNELRTTPCQVRD